MTRTLLRQGMSYGVIGVVSLLVDWGVFVALTAAGMATVPANVIGRIVGAGIGFWFNGTVTFKAAEGTRAGWRQVRRFAVAWVSIAAISTAAVYGIEQQLDLRWAWIGKPFVDAALAALGFLVSRYWIYK